MALIDANINPDGSKGNEELKKHNSAINSTLDIESIQSFLDKAIDQHLIPAIGRAQFDKVVADKTAEAPSPESTTLLLILQRAAVNFALGYFADFGALQISNSGIFVTKSDKTLPASDKKLMALKRQAFADGYAALEMALQYLESKIDQFPLYLSSEERANNRSRFINSSRDFPQKLVISPELFDSLKAIISKVEEEYILPVLGDDLNDQIREKLQTNTLTATDKKLIEHVRKAVASLTLADAIPYRLVNFDGTGAYVKSDTVGGISGNVENRNPAEMNRLQATMCKLSSDGEADLERLRKFLNANTAAYNTYQQSTMANLTKVNDDPNSSVYFL